MKKKKVLLLTSIASVTLFSAAAILFSNNRAENLKADPVMGPTRTVVLDGTTLTAGSYNSEEWTFPLSFHGDKVIGGLYDLDSVDGSFMGPSTTVFGTGGNIVNFTSAQWEVFMVDFFLESRAQVDMDKSVINMKINGTYNNSKIKLIDEDEDYKWLQFKCDFYSNYGDSISIESLKLVFACPL